MLQPIDENHSRLVLQNDSITHTWDLNYPVYQFQTGDINGDGLDEAIVGVIKTTRFDPTIQRRMFIFKNYHGLIRPLWMGSRLGHTLVDFAIVDNCIRAIDRNDQGQYAVNEYLYGAFGPTFYQNIATNVSETEARLILNTTPQNNPNNTLSNP